MSTRLTTNEWMGQWLRHAEGQVKPSTLRSYSQHVRDWIGPAFGWLKLEDLRAEHIDDLMAQMVEQGRSVSTAQRVFATIRRALTVAERRCLLARNVARSTEPPRGREIRRRVDLRAIAAVLDVADGGSLGPFFRFLFATGVRRGEAQGLRWRSVDLDRGLVRIVETVHRVPRKGFVQSTPKSATSRRTVHLDAATMRILRQVRDAQDGTATLLGLQVTEETPVWTNDILGYASPDGWTKEFKGTARQAGYPELTLHSLRHAHATALVELGAHPRTIQQRLGHASAAFTMNVYTSDSDVLDSEAANLFGMRYSTEPESVSEKVSLDTR